MAESGLSLGFSDFKQSIGYFLDYGLTGWSVAEEAEIERIVQTGVRRVHYPVLPGAPPHEWSWLRPSTSLTLVVDQYNYTTGTNLATELPDAFGRLIGEFHYALESNLSRVMIVPLGAVLEARASYDKSGNPEFAAFRYTSSDGSAGQHSEVLFYPTPDVAKVLSYEYEAYAYALSDSAPYPLGGSQLSELFKESCLAVAESDILDEGNGIHMKTYQAMLMDAIMRDKSRRGKQYGNMGDNTNGPISQWQRGHTGSSYPITYKSVEY